MFWEGKSRRETLLNNTTNQHTTQIIKTSYIIKTIKYYTPPNRVTKDNNIVLL